MGQDCPSVLLYMMHSKNDNNNMVPNNISSFASRGHQRLSTNTYVYIAIYGLVLHMHPHKESRAVMGCLSRSLLMLLCNRYWTYMCICMCLYMCAMSIGHTCVSVCVCTCAPCLLAIHTYLYVFVHVHHVYWPYIRICMCLYVCTMSIGHTYVSVCVCTCAPCLLAIHTHYVNSWPYQARALLLLVW